MSDKSPLTRKERLAQLQTKQRRREGARTIIVVSAAFVTLVAVVTTVAVLIIRERSKSSLDAVRVATFDKRDHTTDPEIRTLAYDIATTQQHQIGQMYAWLALWGLPQAPSGPPMTWMRDHHADTPSEPASMPGMATADQLKALEKASGREAEVLFLRLMIPHHQGGASMAQAALQLSAQREVRLLAQAMLTAQSSEIEVMRRLLTARGDSGLQKTSAAGP